MTGFTLDPTEDRQTLQERLPERATDVVRPAAPEWRECERASRPVLQEVAGAGTCILDVFAHARQDESALPHSVDEGTGEMQRLVSTRPVSGLQIPAAA